MPFEYARLIIAAVAVTKLALSAGSQRVASYVLPPA
jgi:hypothetical protein